MPEPLIIFHPGSGGFTTQKASQLTPGRKAFWVTWYSFLNIPAEGPGFGGTDLAGWSWARRAASGPRRLGLSSVPRARRQRLLRPPTRAITAPARGAAAGE